MIGPKDLLADLQKQLRSLERDLLARAESDAGIDTRLRRRYSDALTRSRTGLSFEAWRGQQLTQVAAGWVLACVYTRFCEDNGLLDQPMLAGPGDRLAEARERQTDYFRQHPEESDLSYLRAAVGRLEEHEATRALVDRHNPMHLASPSADVATELLEFWRRIDPATGTLVHDFTDEHLDTRFLGDLYQDLSEQARKDYALLQTPEFIEEFILDHTLDPAIDEYGLAQVRLIDPACGSGHFLLGAFARLLGRWRHQEPGTNVRVLVERVLGQVHGVDINPYAVAIARFRLVVAALTACRITRLDDTPAWKIRVATGDSLRFGVQYGQGVLAGITELALTGTVGEGEFVYEYEDAAELQAILGQRYHAVVANPPYITVKDPALNGLYRELWDACSGKYPLSVPFAQRLFDLAVDGGFAGQITSNSFMKREFGKKLIEQFFSHVDLSLVIDTSGAYIPGHATPTVIICGRNRRPVASAVRAVLGIRGEPNVPAEPAKGMVWTSIIDHADSPGARTEYVSVTDMPRERLASHPWSLSGGGAQDLIQIIVENGNHRIGERAIRIGVFGMTNADDVMLASAQSWQRKTGSLTRVRRAVTGEEVRDWKLESGLFAFFPYDAEFHLYPLVGDPSYLHWLWPCRTILGNRATFAKATYFSEGRPWYEWHQITLDPTAHRWAITWAEIATHNHFVLDRSGDVFKQTAPVIKLSAMATELDHLWLIYLLNSSTACFWLKQVSHSKGVGGIGGGIGDEEWEPRYAFNASRVEQFPLPDGAPVGLTTQLDGLAAKLQQVRPSQVAAGSVPTRASLDTARAAWERLRLEMISAQEELDWEVYDQYGLLGNDADVLIAPGIAKPPLNLGERAFEIALARRMAAGEIETEWFKRHRSTPITEPPAHWSSEYRTLVERRLAKIAEDPYLQLIERPECKRRWASRTWEEMEADALGDWLLGRLEDRALWFRPSPSLRTAAQLADALRTDADFPAVAGLYARDADLGDVAAGLVRDQHVPFLAALRYTESGMRIRAQWEKTWDLQRREDAGEKAGEIAVPPKYRQGDFRELAYWRSRGKLDVPKERFISYPGASRDGTLLLGWAGWDHLQQAQALTAYITERRELDAWDAERLTPLLAGLAELLPWVAQWHPGVDPEFGVRPADAYNGFLDEQLLQLGLTRDDLTAWQPEPLARGRRTT
jgi:hypothetical protein